MFLAVTLGKVIPPQWWDIEAALKALSQSNDIVLIDGGRGQCIEQLELLEDQPCVLLVELSILGLARTQSFLLNMAESRVNSSTSQGPVRDFSYWKRWGRILVRKIYLSRS